MITGTTSSPAYVSAGSILFLIPGNHDGNIDLLVPESVSVSNSSGMIFGDILLIHGHTLPEQTKSNINKIIMGHIHPIFNNCLINGEIDLDSLG